MTNRALLFLILAVFFPMLFLVLLGNGFVHPSFVWNDSTTAVIHMVLMVWVSKRLSDLIVNPSGTFSVLRIPFNLFQYIFFLLVPAHNYFNNIVFGYITLNFDDVTYRNAYLLVLVSYVSYLIGERLAKPRTGTRLAKSPPLSLIRYSRLPLMAVGLCTISVGFFITTIGDAEFLFADRTVTEARIVDAEAQSFALLVDALVRVPAFCAFYIAFYLFIIGYWKGSGPIFRMLLPITFVAFVVFNFPASVPRLWLGGTSIAILLVFLHKKFERANFAFAAFVVFAIMIVFPLTHVLRFVFTYSIERGVTEIISGAFSDAQFDAFQMVMILQTYVDDRAHTYGWQTLSALLFFVPREIFPSKGKSIGSVVGEDLGFTFVNISSPMVAEIYFDFSYFGVIVLFAAIGYVSHKVDRLWTAGNYGLAGSLIVPYIAGWQFILYRGSMFTALNYLVPTVAILLTIGLFVRREDRNALSKLDQFNDVSYRSPPPIISRSPRND